jgi:hypothetical protein
VARLRSSQKVLDSLGGAVGLLDVNEVTAVVEHL